MAPHAPITLPSLPRDYSTIWADTFLASGGDPVAEARKLDLYVEAVNAVDRGEIKLPGLDGPSIARTIRDYVATLFSERISVRQPDHTWHRALSAALHKQAIDCLGTGDLPGVEQNEAAAEQIHAYVRRRLLDTFGR